MEKKIKEGKFYYTADGNKVLLVNVLSEFKYAVHKVYIDSEGKEVISKAIDIVSELFELPVKTWRENRIDGMEALLKEREKQLDKKLEDIKLKTKQADDYIKSLSQLAANEGKTDVKNLFDEIEKFFSPGKKYIVKNFDIVELNLDWMTADYGGISLITLFGKSNGSLGWKINKYSDGSGFDRLIFEDIYDSFEKAKEALKKKILESTDWNYTCAVEKAEEYGIELPKDRIRQYYNNKLEQYQGKLFEYETDVEKTKKEIENIKTKMT